MSNARNFVTRRNDIFSITPNIIKDQLVVIGHMKPD